jgi:pimeloyl-ACP methyl ester carboxylesterase
MINRVRSADGTPIAYHREGDGPAVILVAGGLDDGSENAPLVPKLAEHFTVFNYARRGRGDSGDTRPYALEREIEDLAALIAEAGGSAHLYGVSAGGGLVLEAAAAGVAAGRMGVYEVPYCVTDETLGRAKEFVAELEPAIEEGRRGDALAAFMRFAGSSEEDIEAGRAHPMWAASEALAHTMVYDVACMAGYRPPTERLARITQPTLVATGGAQDPHLTGSPPDFFDLAADAIVASVPNTRRVVLAGQAHVADPKIVAEMLAEFFKEGVSESLARSWTDQRDLRGT